MDNGQAMVLGLKQQARELTAFEIEAFFTFTLAEQDASVKLLSMLALST